MVVIDNIEEHKEYQETNILVVSKTKMKNNHVCIGTISSSGKYMRLLYPDNKNMKNDIDININDHLFIKYKNRKDIVNPHTEDINMYFAKKISINNKPLPNILKSLNATIWTGKPTVLFDGKLIWSKAWQSKGYISDKNIPTFSVGFWIANQDLYLNNGRYEYITDNNTFSIPYVGVNEPQECIYKGTVVRVSLARWWKNSNYFDDERCYLQISECYPLEEESNILNKIQSSIDNNIKININYFINGKYIMYKNVIPYKIIYLNNNYYVASEVEEQYKFTLFRVTKTRAVVQTNTKFNYDKNILDFINYIQTPFSKYTENFRDNMIEVKVEIDKEKSPFFEIRKHLPSQKIINRKENGNMIVSFRVTQEREVEDLIKQWIPYIKVIEPKSLDKKIKEDINQYLQ